MRVITRVHSTPQQWLVEVDGKEYKMPIAAPMNKLAENYHRAKARWSLGSILGHFRACKDIDEIPTGYYTVAAEGIANIRFCDLDIDDIYHDQDGTLVIELKE
jgi:hypothetical protein